MLASISKATKAVLGGLSAAWGGSLLGGLLLGKPKPPHGMHLPGWVARGSSGLLTVLSWSFRRLLRGSPVADYATHIATGMTLGAVGDVRMGRSVPAGMGAFALGHV